MRLQQGKIQEPRAHRDYERVHFGGNAGSKSGPCLGIIEVRPPPGWPVHFWGLLPLPSSKICCFLLLVLISAGQVSRAAVQPKLQSRSDAPYELHLFHTHTGERLNIVYRNDKGYDPESLARLNSYLRDHRTGDVHDYDPRVFDLLHDLMAALGDPDREIDVVCGYRTPWSNEFLRTHGHGVARHSLHMQAMAIDIRVPGVSAAQLRDAALALHRGGVGYYASSNFVHVDVGRVRRW
jgi:uncharacterized protein YcbK (DUF882 family)